MNMRGPSEPEETDWEENGSKYGDGHTFLRFQLALVVVLWFLYVVQVGEEGRHDGERANGNPEKRQAEDLSPPMVDTDENEWKGFEPDV